MMPQVLILLAFVFSPAPILSDDPVLGPFEREFDCLRGDLKNYQEYREAEMAYALQVIEQLAEEEVQGMLDDGDDLTTHILIQAPWILDSKATIFGTHRECHTKLKLVLGGGSELEVQKHYGEWASCLTRAFPESSSVIDRHVTCLGNVVSKGQRPRYGF